MKLFLASQDLGNFSQTLAELVGEKKRALVISNARDYYQDENRIEDSLAKTFINLKNIGITSKRLDLRKYFDDPDQLTKEVQTYDPGLIFSIGGNVFCLATALHQSGMDKIIQHGLQNDNFVYGGYSAGSMVAANDLSLYDVKKVDSEDKPYNMSNKTLQTYNLHPYSFGLNLIDSYIIPHANREDHTEMNKQRIKKFTEYDAKYILLDDQDIYVVNNSEPKILKG